MDNINLLENEINKYKKVLEELEAMTRNPREYEPSYYTINHIIREVLNSGNNEYIEVCRRLERENNCYKRALESILHSFYPLSIDDAVQIAIEALNT